MRQASNRERQSCCTQYFGPIQISLVSIVQVSGQKRCQLLRKTGYIRGRQMTRPGIREWVAALFNNELLSDVKFGAGQCQAEKMTTRGDLIYQSSILQQRHFTSRGGGGQLGGQCLFKGGVYLKSNSFVINNRKLLSMKVHFQSLFKLDCIVLVF